MKKLLLVLLALVLLAPVCSAVQLGQGLGDKFTSVSVGTTDVISNISSGIYTPVYTAGGSGYTTMVPGQAQWIRIGNIVTVSGVFNMDPNDTTMGFRWTPPIPSDFASDADLSGLANTNSDATSSGYVYANSGNDDIVFLLIGANGGDVGWRYCYSYIVK